MRGNYLKSYYLDDHKLAQRARLEFYRALQTNRMIAFVGAMGTEAFGYGNWDVLKQRFGKAAGETLDAIIAASPADGEIGGAARRARAEIQAFEALVLDKKLDAITGMSMIEEALTLPGLRGALPRDLPDQSDPDRPWPLDQYETVHAAMRVRLAQCYRRPERSEQAPPEAVESQFAPYDVPTALWRGLGIRRFATPSYDFEIERRGVLDEHPTYQDGGFTDPFAALRSLRENREAAGNESFHWDLGSGRIRRVYADGWAVESDMVNRERIDRMIEFAVGTDDVDAHIMHLHGRACNARSMIISRRDYDALYRRNDLNRAPFEFAKKMMMGGNPLLFVGLGMGEQELNREMEEFISNAPYQRVAPTFLLWNAGEKLGTVEHRRAFRLEKLARFGVLTIFDTDLPQGPSPRPVAPTHADPKRAERAAALRDLADAVTALAPSTTPCLLRDPTLRETHVGTRWRSMAGRVGVKDEPVVLWGPTRPQQPRDEAWRDGLDRLVARVKASSMLAVIGSQGSGKGTISAGIARRAVTQPAALGVGAAEDCLIINGGFAFDTDTLLDAVALFLQRTLDSGHSIRWRQDGKPQTSGKPLMSRGNFFRRLSALGAEGSRPCLIVINGLERFCGVSGEPLSAELDELLRLAKPGSTATWPVRFLLLGSTRVRKYCGRLGCEPAEFAEFFEPCTRDARPAIRGDRDRPALPGGYFSDIWKFMIERELPESQALYRAIARYDANGSTHVSGDLIELRRELFSLIFDEKNLARLVGPSKGVPASLEDATLARLILRALAFIGAPVEQAVLCRMPGLRTYRSNDIERLLTRLCEASLILGINGYRPLGSSPDANRFALHRSLLTELRYRFGIPLNEAKLSTAFNMALYVAQPIDGDIPDSDIHDELGEAIDRLIGAYRHAPLVETCRLMLDVNGPTVAIAEKVAAACGHCGPLAGAEDHRRMFALCSREYVQSLRGALAMIRGYYSTTGLLTLDSGDRTSSVERDGILLEHAERLDALIDAYGKVTLARAEMRAQMGDKRRFEQWFGPAEPFYPDELVWMHNERGVVRLAMGDLYEARRSFDQAMLVNRRWVEADDTGHNWRRIRLNQLMVETEMGEISRVERFCDEIERVTPPYPAGDPRGPTEPSDEDERALAIVTAHRAWCHQLRGDVARARVLFGKALKTFSELGEVRAQAYYGRLEAELSDDEPTTDKRIARIVAVQHMAQSARQMDILHRVQVTLANTWLFGSRDRPPSNETRQRANRMLEEALTYAIQADVHRVRLEASMTIARARLQTADYEGALRYAMDAMMIAARYGMELRKITLRAIIAQVMVARGHPVTAEKLARTCIKMATRKRFQTAIDHAERVILDIPRVSSSISQSDGSGRRDF